MSEEPQPAADQKLDQALMGSLFIWLGLTIGLTIMAIMIVIVQAFTLDGPLLDSPEIGYAFLLVVPLGLLGAFFVAPKLTKDPAEVIRRSRSNDPTAFAAWEGTTEADPYYWLPAFMGEFFMKVGLLEGPGVICVVAFLLTGEWVILAGAGVMLAALISQMPTRAKFDAWAANARDRRASADPSE